MRTTALAPLLLALLATPSPGDDFPHAPPPGDPDALGRHVQRTMTLLATSTPEHRNRVRILFYGQSITEQDWSKAVAADLRRRFPHADLQVENRAIGGFASQLLIKPAEHDLYPFYPDLLIFHVYGSHLDYEAIIREARSRTAAEVLMQKDHLTKWPPETIDREKDKGTWWDDMMNHTFLPEIARKYGCGLVDNRSGWVDYLKANHLEPKALLSDDVHLNAHGNHLMAELVSRYLVHRPDLPPDEWRDLARTFEVGKDLAWKDGRLALDFDGNRIDALALAGAGSARVRIDGKAPSEFPGAFAITRPKPGPWSPLFLDRVDRDAPLALEDWTLTITGYQPEPPRWTFDLSGSVTGPDGSGASDAPFRSTSGRVRIEPTSWFRTKPVPVGYKITWSVVPEFRDAYTAPASIDPTLDNPATLAQGIPNAHHTLELIADDPANPPPLKALRAYRPPCRPSP